MLGFPKCPACSGELPLKQFYQEWQPPNEYSNRPAPGLECPSCLARLRPDKRRTVLVAVAVFAAFTAIFIALEDVFVQSRIPSLAIVIAFCGLLIWALMFLSRRFVTWRVAAAGEELEFPLHTRAQRAEWDAAAKREQESK